MSDELTADARGERGRVPDRRLLLAGGLVASLLLGGGAFLLVGGEEPVEEVVFAVPRRAAVAATAPPTPTPSPSAGHRHAEPIDPFLAQVRNDPGGDVGPSADPLTPVPPDLPDDGLPTGLPTGPSDDLPLDGLPPLPDPVPSEGVPTPSQPPAPRPTRPADPTATPPRTPPTTPVALRQTLVLTQVKGSAPDLVGRFLLDGVPVEVPVQTSFGPGQVLHLEGLIDGPRGWTAVVRTGTATPVDLPVGEVLRFG